MDIEKIDFEWNWLCKIDFEVMWFMLGCFYYKIKLGVKFSIKFWIQNRIY